MTPLFHPQPTDGLMLAWLERLAASFWVTTLVVLIATAWIGSAAAEDKSIYSPIILVDKQKGYILVSSDAGVIAVEASEAAKPHLGKLPPSGMIDIVVELRPGNPPLLKSWKLAAGESDCKHFDGQTCR